MKQLQEKLYLALIIKKVSIMLAYLNLETLYNMPNNYWIYSYLNDKSRTIFYLTLVIGSKQNS